MARAMFFCLLLIGMLFEQQAHSGVKLFGKSPIPSEGVDPSLNRDDVLKLLKKDPACGRLKDLERFRDQEKKKAQNGSIAAKFKVDEIEREIKKVKPGCGGS